MGIVNDKKGVMMKYLLAMILGVVLIVMMVWVLYIGNRTNWKFIQDLPVNYTDKDKLIDLSAEELEALNCKRIGKIGGDGYLVIGDVKSNIYLGESGKLWLDVDKGVLSLWGEDEEIGKIDEGVVDISYNFLYEDSEEYVKNKEYLPTLSELSKLHTAYQFGDSSILCVGDYGIEIIDRPDSGLDVDRDDYISPEEEGVVCLGKGEVLVPVIGGSGSWECACDSRKGKLGGYYSASVSGAWTWFQPPCVRMYDKDENSFVYDSSVLNGEDSDYGVCVSYVSLLRYNQLRIAQGEANQGAKRNFVPDRLIELQDAGLKKGYVKKLAGPLSSSFVPVYIGTRKECYLRAGNLNREVYNIFYTSVVDNLEDGFSDDVGYCLRFEEGENKIIDIYQEGASRQYCYEDNQNDKDDVDVGYSFFVSDTGSEDLVIVASDKISIKYSDNYRATSRGDDLTEDYVTDKCRKWDSRDLTFVTGMLQGSEEYWKDSTRRVRACGYEIDYLIGIGDVVGEYTVSRADTINLGNDKDICCSAVRV